MLLVEVIIVCKFKHFIIRYIYVRIYTFKEFISHFNMLTWSYSVSRYIDIYYLLHWNALGKLLWALWWFNGLNCYTRLSWNSLDFLEFLGQISLSLRTEIWWIWFKCEMLPRHFFLKSPYVFVIILFQFFFNKILNNREP